VSSDEGAGEESLALVVLETAKMRPEEEVAHGGLAMVSSVVVGSGAEAVRCLRKENGKTPLGGALLL
jgi:hypothetical protein